LSDALAKIPGSDPDMLVVLSDPFMFTHRKALIERRARSRPVELIFAVREFVWQER
jgi:hypothetical protein